MGGWRGYRRSECDRGGGLSARMEIKMNMGEGGGVSVLFRVIKKTSRATVSFFLFFNTRSSFSARSDGGTRGGVGEGAYCFRGHCTMFAQARAFSFFFFLYRRSCTPQLRSVPASEGLRCSRRLCC